MVCGLRSVVGGLQLVVCGRSVVCGVWLVVCGLWSVVFSLWFVVFGLWSVAGGLPLVVCDGWSVFDLWLVCGVWCVVCGVWCACVCVWYRTLHTLFRRRSGNLFWRRSCDVPVTVGTSPEGRQNRLLERRQNSGKYTQFWAHTRRTARTTAPGGGDLGNRGKQINYPPLRWLGPRSSAWGLEGRVKPNHLPRSGWAPGRLPGVWKGE